MPTSVSKKINDFFVQYPKRSYPKNHIIVFPNESPDHIYFLANGSVRMYDISYRGEEVVVNIFRPSAFFPMSWAVNHISNEFFYATDEVSEVYVAPIEDTLSFVKENPDVMLDLLSRVYRGLDGILGRMVRLMSGSAASRLLYELIIECRRSAKNPAATRFNVPLNETALAARTGLTRETVSREIHKLKEKGLVSISPKGIQVKDIPAIEKMLGESV